MSFQPSVQAHYHQEFNFAENNETTGCCCFFKSKPKEYVVDLNYQLRGLRKRADTQERIVANQRLAELVKSKFEEDPIANNIAFEILKGRIDDKMIDGPVTEERLAKIVTAIYELKSEINT